MNTIELLPLTMFLGGFLLGSLMTACLAFPAVGRAVAKILGVCLLGGGLGFLIWAGVTVHRGERLRPPFGTLITEPGEAFGWGAGFLVGGIVALVLAFRGRSAGRDQAGRV
jgi:hypothetical protein